MDFHILSPSWPFSISWYRGKIYLEEAGSNVAFWHEADLRLAAPQGPLTVPLPTSGPECRFIAAFQTLCRRVLKVV